MKVKVLPGQCLSDLAVQYLGDAARVVELAQMNGISVTDSLQAGTELEMPAAAKKKKPVVQLFTDLANAPATDKPVLVDVVNEGIGYWIIEYDFKVS